MKTIIALLTILALAGCTTTPTPIGAARAVPNNRIYYSLPGPATSSAQIVVIRDTGWMGGVAYAHFFIDGNRAASIDTGEMLRLTIPPGDFALGVRLTDPLDSHTLYSIDQHIVAGNTYYYRVLVDQQTGARIQRFFPANSSQ